MTLPLCCSVCSLPFHVRVSVVFYRVERFFYRVDGDPAHQVQDADFVVGAGFSDSAERGLHYRRAYRPAVDVEVSRGVGEAAAYQFLLVRARLHRVRDPLIFCFFHQPHINIF